MKGVIFLLISMPFLLPTWIMADETGCQPDISQANHWLTEAQELLDAGDVDSALGKISEARRALQMQEARCRDFAPENAGSSRTNPVQFGQTQSVDLRGVPIQITLLDFVDNANDLVLERNSRNAPPSDGMRYVVVEFNFFCDRPLPDSCEFRKSQYSLVGSRGIVYEQEFGYDREFIDNLEIFGGSEVVISRPFQVGIDETDFVFFNDRGGRVYFATE
jgi:hypothetical protein